MEQIYTTLCLNYLHFLLTGTRLNCRHERLILADSHSNVDPLSLHCYTLSVTMSPDSVTIISTTHQYSLVFPFYFN